MIGATAQSTISFELSRILSQWDWRDAVTKTRSNPVWLSSMLSSVATLRKDAQNLPQPMVNKLLQSLQKSVQPFASLLGSSSAPTISLEDVRFLHQASTMYVSLLGTGIANVGEVVGHFLSESFQIPSYGSPAMDSLKRAGMELGFFLYVAQQDFLSGPPTQETLRKYSLELSNQLGKVITALEGVVPQDPLLDSTEERIRVENDFYVPQLGDHLVDHVRWLAALCRPMGKSFSLAMRATEGLSRFFLISMTEPLNLLTLTCMHQHQRLSIPVEDLEQIASPTAKEELRKLQNIIEEGGKAVRSKGVSFAASSTSASLMVKLLHRDILTQEDVDAGLEAFSIRMGIPQTVLRIEDFIQALQGVPVRIQAELWVSLGTGFSTGTVDAQDTFSLIGNGDKEKEEFPELLDMSERMLREELVDVQQDIVNLEREVLQERQETRPLQDVVMKAAVMNIGRTASKALIRQEEEEEEEEERSIITTTDRINNWAIQSTRQVIQSSEAEGELQRLRRKEQRIRTLLRELQGRVGQWSRRLTWAILGGTVLTGLAVAAYTYRAISQQTLATDVGAMATIAATNSASGWFALIKASWTDSVAGWWNYVFQSAQATPDIFATIGNDILFGVNNMISAAEGGSEEAYQQIIARFATALQIDGGTLIFRQLRNAANLTQRRAALSALTEFFTQRHNVLVQALKGLNSTGGFLGTLASGLGWMGAIIAAPAGALFSALNIFSTAQAGQVFSWGTLMAAAGGGFSVMYVGALAQFSRVIWKSAFTIPLLYQQTVYMISNYVVWFVIDDREADQQVMQARWLAAQQVPLDTLNGLLKDVIVSAGAFTMYRVTMSGVALSGIVALVPVIGGPTAIAIGGVAFTLYKLVGRYGKQAQDSVEQLTGEPVRGPSFISPALARTPIAPRETVLQLMDEGQVDNPFVLAGQQELERIRQAQEEQMLRLPPAGTILRLAGVDKPPAQIRRKRIRKVTTKPKIEEVEVHVSCSICGDKASFQCKCEQNQNCGLFICSNTSCGAQNWH